MNWLRNIFGISPRTQTAGERIDVAAERVATVMERLADGMEQQIGQTAPESISDTPSIEGRKRRAS